MMEAREFLEKYRKMCQTYPDCNGCPLSGEKCSSDMGDLDKIIPAVENWHPRTRKTVLLEQYPHAPMLLDGKTPKACPKNLDEELERTWCGKYVSCTKCREDYWNEIVD